MKFVAVEYIICQEQRENGGMCRLESGVGEKLVMREIKRFNIEDEFDVLKQTIFNCT